MKREHEMIRYRAGGDTRGRRFTLGAAFVLAATTTTAGIYFLGPQMLTSPLRSVFSLSPDATLIVSSSLSSSCAGTSTADDLGDSLFILHTHDDDYNGTYVPFALPSVLSAAPELTPARRPLEYVDSLPLRCLDAFVSRGETCEDRDDEAAHRIRQTTFDIVWTWVNGSDHLHQQAAIEATREYFPPKQRPNSKVPSELKLYRDHDELRHSLRSVLKNFRRHTRNFRIVTGDFALPDYQIDPTEWDDESCYSNASTSWRLGQTPQFLDFDQDELRDGEVAIKLSHHAQFFSNYTGTSFNSFAIESQLANIKGLSNHIIYLNDDYFFSDSLKPFDFYTPPFGHVLRIQPDLLVTSASKKSSPSDGEWLSLEHTNELLSERFGFRKRPYVVHEAKAASTPLLRELALAFPEAIDATSRNRFRSRPAYEQRDIHPFFMYNHWVVERHREAALWVWAVAKTQERGGTWLDAAWTEVGGSSDSDLLQVRATRRRTLARDHLEEILGKENIGSTSYEFASMDGYPYAGLGNYGVSKWPDMQKPTGRPEDSKLIPHFSCSLNRTQCFSGLTATEFFTRIAFEEVQCGDCILTALVSKSGELGLDALLPKESSTGNSPTSYPSPPALPRVPKWQEADFSVQANVPASADIRDWSVQLLARYRFVIGSTPAKFVLLSTQWQVQSLLAELDSAAGTYNLLCVNDDITSNARQIDTLFRDWMDKKWDEPAAWERQ